MPPSTQSKASLSTASTASSETAPHAQAWSKAWSEAVREPATEFDLTDLPVIQGKIPSDLNGSLYQNGPGRLERGGQRAGHWFDGDGAILAVHFEAGNARACYRYVKTTGYCAEEAANRYLQKGYGMLAPAPWPQRMLADFKNAANTSVLPVVGTPGGRGDRLLALWEGGPPHSLDLQTLETFGLDDLGGSLGRREPYSAHPKVDPITGEIFNFGVKPGPITWLQLYRSAPNGQILQRNQIRLKGVPLIHDMVMAGPYLVFFIPPVRLDLTPALLNLKSFSDALTWNADWGTEILVIERSNLQLVSRSMAPAWFQWHFCNGYVEQSTTTGSPQSSAGDHHQASSSPLVIDLVRYPDFSINDYLKTVAAGYVKGGGQGKLWRLRIAPKTATLLSEECLFDRTCEFPLVDPRQIGQPAEAAYFISHPAGTEQDGELARAFTRLDLRTQQMQSTQMGDLCYPSEPIYAEDWLLSVVFDGGQRQTQLWIFAPDNLSKPYGILQIPQPLPFGFHGCWKNKS